MTSQNTPTGTDNRSADTGPSPIDRGYQLAYFVAYRLMRAYWGVRHPVTHGALIAVWNRGEVLLVRNSYVPYYSAPGGYIRSGEEPSAAAARELDEEIGVKISASQLKLALEVTHEWENKQDHVRIFSLELNDRPSVQVDHREVIEANWFTPAQVAGMNVFPPLKQAILAKTSG